MKIRNNLSVEIGPNADAAVTFDFLANLPHLIDHSLNERFYGTFGEMSEEEYRGLVRMIVQHRGTGALRYCALGREILLMTDQAGNLIQMGN